MSIIKVNTLHIQPFQTRLTTCRHILWLPTNASITVLILVESKFCYNLYFVPNALDSLHITTLRPHMKSSNLKMVTFAHNSFWKISTSNLPAIVTVKTNAHYKPIIMTNTSTSYVDDKHHLTTSVTPLLYDDNMFMFKLQIWWCKQCSLIAANDLE